MRPLRATTRAGFSLLEVLLASALAALLTLAVLQVVASTTTAQARVDAALASAQGTPAWVALLRYDLTHASRVTVGPDTLTCQGQGGLDPATLEPIHCPASVSYSLQGGGEGKYLVRQQDREDLLNNQTRWRELLCDGVESFKVQPLPSPATAPAAALPRIAVPATQPALPGSYRVTVRFSSGGTWDQVLVIR